MSLGLAGEDTEAGAATPMRPVRQVGAAGGIQVAGGGMTEAATAGRAARWTVLAVFQAVRTSSLPF
jgi:hypothetical protein